MVEKLLFKSLAPYMSDEQLRIHYENHHKTYDKNLRLLLSEEEYNKGLPYILEKYKDKRKIINNAAQIHNHNAFWRSIKLDTFDQNKQTPILDSLISDIMTVGCGVFGSGWVWVMDDLSVIATSNAEIPVGKYLIAIDVWEHAYYIDFQYNRKEFLNIFITKMMNWEIIYNHLNILV